MSVRSTLAVLIEIDGAAAAGRARARTTVAAPATNTTTTITTMTVTVTVLFFKRASLSGPRGHFGRVELSAGTGHGCMNLPAAGTALRRQRGRQRKATMSWGGLDVAGRIEPRARVPGRANRLPARAQLDVVQAGRHVELALSVWIRPVVDSMLAHALSEPAHHRRVVLAAAAGPARLRRQLVEDGLTGLNYRRRRTGGAAGKVGLTLVVDGRVGEVWHAVLASALHQAMPGWRCRVPDTGRVLGLPAAGRQHEAGHDDRHEAGIASVHGADAMRAWVSSTSPLKGNLCP